MGSIVSDLRLVGIVNSNGASVWVQEKKLKSLLAIHICSYLTRYFGLYCVIDAVIVNPSDFSFASMPSLATSDAAPQSELKVPLYEASTQFKNWRFSVEQLAYTRETLNEAATAAIRNTFENDEVLNFLFLSTFDT